MKASFSGANQLIPAPNSSLETLIANFQQHGLDVSDLVALSGEILYNFHIHITTN
jgi:peroxidase